MRHDEDGRVVEIGARTRTIPPAIRRALHHRDRGCRFPGLWVALGEGHHVRHWADGGPTTLSNLALLCRRHHRAVHEDGYRIDRTPVATFRLVDRTPSIGTASLLPPRARRPDRPVASRGYRHPAVRGERCAGCHRGVAPVRTGSVSVPADLAGTAHSNELERCSGRYPASLQSIWVGTFRDCRRHTTCQGPFLDWMAGLLLGLQSECMSTRTEVWRRQRACGKRQRIDRLGQDVFHRRRWLRRGATQRDAARYHRPVTQTELWRKASIVAEGSDSRSVAIRSLAAEHGTSEAGSSSTRLAAALDVTCCRSQVIE